MSVPSSPGAGSATRCGRDDALDGIRAIAAIGVVLFHLSMRRLPGGWIGVDVFFVLSGFLITGLVVREIDATGGLDLARFYRRRSLRLWPAFGAMVVGTLALAAARPGTGVTPAGALYAATFMANWSNAFDWAPEGALSHCWSLAVEQQFYLLWPLVLVAIPPRRRIAATLALVGVAIAWRWWLLAHGASVTRTYNGLDSHADGLLVGALLFFADGAVAAAPASAGGRRLLAGGSILLAVVAAIAMLLPSRELLMQVPTGITVTSLASAALIACARRPGWLHDALGWPPLAATGRVSYGIYLWHYPVLAFGRTYVQGIGLLVPVAVSVGLAVLSYRYVEQPFLRLSTRPAGGGERVSGGVEAAA